MINTANLTACSTQGPTWQRMFTTSVSYSHCPSTRDVAGLCCYYASYSTLFPPPIKNSITETSKRAKTCSCWWMMKVVLKESMPLLITSKQSASEKKMNCCYQETVFNSDLLCLEFYSKLTPFLCGCRYSTLDCEFVCGDCSFTSSVLKGT